MTAPGRLTRATAMPLAVAFLALVPAGASAVADVIKSTNNNEFDQPTYSSDEGDLVRFQHSGGGPHNVTSTQFSGGERLFSSATIASGTTAVDGTQASAPSSTSALRRSTAPGTRRRSTTDSSPGSRACCPTRAGSISRRWRSGGT